MKDVDFIRDRYTTLGGLSLCLAQFLVQFFSIRLLGAAVTAGIGVLSAMLYRSGEREDGFVLITALQNENGRSFAR